MTVSPIDIESRRFKRELFGYSRRDVDQMLRTAADTLSQANLERDDLSRALTTARKEVEEHRGREQTLMEALVSAQRLIEERKALAEQEVERILRHAREQAEQMLTRTRGDLTRIEQQILRLKVERENFENKLLALLDEHRRLVEIRRQEAGLSDKLRPRTTLPPPPPPSAPDGHE
jgi:cell division initiation protein